MINNITNNILNSSSSELSDSNDKILALSKKKAQETFDNNIPSPESFKNKLNGISSNSPTTLRKAEQIYQKTTRTIEKAIQKLEGSKRELQVIKDKLVGIGENFTFLNNLASFSNNLINKLPIIFLFFSGSIIFLSLLK